MMSIQRNRRAKDPVPQGVSSVQSDDACVSTRQTRLVRVCLAFFHPASVTASRLRTSRPADHLEWADMHAPHPAARLTLLVPHHGSEALRLLHPAATCPLAFGSECEPSLRSSR